MRARGRVCMCVGGRPPRLTFINARAAAGGVLCCAWRGYACHHLSDCCAVAVLPLLLPLLQCHSVFFVFALDTVLVAVNTFVPLSTSSAQHSRARKRRAAAAEGAAAERERAVILVSAVGP